MVCMHHVYASVCDGEAPVVECEVRSSFWLTLVNDSISPPGTSNLSNSLPSNDEKELTKDTSSMVFFVDDSRRRIYTEFTRITTSQYTDALDAIIHHRWAECYIHRSENFLDDEATYHPSDDAITITIVDQVSLEPIVNDESGLYGTSRFIHLTSKETPTDPAILHRPDRIHSYKDDQLFGGFVTNFHNEIGATYQWHLNDTVILTGA